MKYPTNTLKTLLAMSITIASLCATAAGNEGRGGANDAIYKGRPILLDRLEYLTTKEHEYKEVAEIFPEVAKLTQEFKDKNLLYDIGAVMDQSPARNKRWEFSKLPLSLDSQECKNALVYEVEKVGVLACQDAEYVRISAGRLVKMSREDQVWTINHELLVGLLLGRYIGEERTKKLEPTLRKVNANMMARVKKEPLKWNKFMLADFKSVTGSDVYSREEVDAALQTMSTHAEGFCALASDLLAKNPAPLGYVGEIEFDQTFKPLMQTWIKEIQDLEKDPTKGKLPAYFEPIDAKYEPLAKELQARQNFSRAYDKTIKPQTDELTKYIDRLSAAAGSDVLRTQVARELNLDVTAIYNKEYRLRDSSLGHFLSSWMVSENSAIFIQKNLAILNASKLNCGAR